MDDSIVAVKLEQKNPVEHQQAPVQATPPRLSSTVQPFQVMLGPVDQPSVAEQLRIELGQLRKDGLLDESQHWHRRATEITLEANTQLNAFVSSQLQLDALP